MGLMDEIRAQHRRSGHPCGVKTVLDQLEGDDAVEFMEAVNDPGITGTSISRAIQNRGLRLNGEVITRHRRKECTCELG